MIINDIMDFKRGSEWRKWDLHIHSLYSNLNNHFSNCSDEEYINKIKEKQISVVGLTNYFNFTDKDFELKRKMEENGIVVFLNLELRLTYQNVDDQNCDFHIIFNDCVGESIIKMFLSNLDVKVSGTRKKANQISGSDYDTGVVEFEALLEKLNEESLGLKNQYLLGFLSRGHGSSRSATTYENIANNTHILIHSSDIERNIQEDRDFWLEYNKPLVQSSDAHSLDQIGEKYTRIKADPTFEGLKQILYEPDERIKIQETNPNFDFDKPYFKKVIINENIRVYSQEDSEIKITTNEIELNNNLVAIIGGRGTGKSTLIGCINNVFDNNDNFLKDENFKIVYAKNNDSNPSLENYISGEKNYLDYIYIPQGYLKENSGKNEISKYIKTLLSIDDGFSVEISEKIDSNTEKIQGIKKWFDVTDDKGNQINNKDFINAEKDKNEQMLKSIETDKNKQDLTTYTTNVEKIAKIQGQIDKLEKLLSSLDEIEKINENIELINTEYQNIQGFTPISKVEYINQKNNIEKNKTNLSNQISDLQSDNEKIKGTFKRYAGDLQSLLSNAESYKRNITSAEVHLQAIREKENELSRLLEERKTFGKIIYDEYMRIKNDIDDGWNNITSNRNKQQKELIENLLLKKNGDTGIKVEGSIDFDEEKFYSGLFDIVDNRKYKKKEDIKEKMGITDIESWYKFIENGFEEFSDNDKVISYFLDVKTRNNYIKVNSNISYMKKKLGHLSVGQRGTVLLCLQLATKAFSAPIIFDQPEDDLDNQFIMEELVNIFKELKKYRQIIIVTHNANLVVNADAEQVIVADNNDEELTYTTGSIENELIRRKICDILEGGEYAFKKRENKYGL